MLAAVILSAGQSRRMGTPKALVDLRGKTFLSRILEATQHPQIALVRVVLGAADGEVRRALNLPDDIVIVNPDWERGQLSSIQAAIHALSGGPITADAIDGGAIDGILLWPVDHPMVSGAVVDALASAFDSSAKTIVVPTFHGRRGHPMIFARSLFPELLAAPDDQGARAVVWSHADDVDEVPTDEEGVVLNLNDPEALRRARGDESNPPTKDSQEPHL